MIKTNLRRKSNAVLIEVDGGGDSVVAIIKCDKKEDITFKVARAIKEHSVGTFVTITNKTVLNNPGICILINSLITNDDDTKDTRNYTLHIVPTY